MSFFYLGSYQESNGSRVFLQIVQRYDILLIQEIRDITETAIEDLIDAVNADIG